MPQPPSLRLFPVSMLQPKCRLLENSQVTGLRLQREQATQWAPSSMQQLMCPRLETVAPRSRPEKVSFGHPQSEKAPDSREGPMHQ